MTEPEADREPAEQRFTLVAVPPVRPLAAAAAVTVVGAALLVLGGTTGSTLWRVAGAVVLGLGLGLALLAWLFWRRLRAEVSVDADGVTVRSGRRARSLRWGEIAEVTATPLRLTLVPKPGVSHAGRGLVIVNPQPATAPVFAALAAAVRARLDADRGYRSLD